MKLETTIPILGNPQLMRLFQYLPPYKGYIIGAAICMILGGWCVFLDCLGAWEAHGPWFWFFGN